MFTQNQQNSSQQQAWLKRLGWAGVLFFTLKGIAWIAAFVLVGQYGFQF